MTSLKDFIGEHGDDEYRHLVPAGMNLSSGSSISLRNLIEYFRDYLSIFSQFSSEEDKAILC